MQKSLLNLIYAQIFAFSRKWMYLRAVGRRLSQMNAYFLVINSKRCKKVTEMIALNHQKIKD